MNVSRVLIAVAGAWVLLWAQSPPPAKAPTKKAAPAARGKAPARTTAKSKATAKSGTRKSTVAARKKTPARTAASKSAHPTTKKTAGASKKAAPKTGQARKAPVRRPAGQQRPTAERYREIEAALHERGYLSEAPSGNWSVASVDALKRFQTDQDLAPTGRLDSMSLIRLGLGPSRQ